jgi:membrane-bound lytic murein transglycosylase B
VYHNYEAILDYNCSNHYAVSVGLLADEVKSPENPKSPGSPKRP